MSKRMRIVGGGVFAVAFFCAAQNLAPEILLYARIKAHTLAQQTDLPDYTCLETISRFHRDSARGSLKLLDTVRLEVIYSNGKEWFGAPGGSAMDSSEPMKFVGSGLIGSGIFATGLLNILHGAQFTFGGDTTLKGHPAVRYDVTFSPHAPAFGITMPGGSGNLGEEGSLWADRDSLDLLRLELRAANIPSYLPLAAQDTSVNYAQMRLNGTSALLPEDADMNLIQTDGVGDFDHLDFTHCRAYGAESTISFDTAPATDGSSGTATPSSKAPAAPPNLPASLKVAIALTTPVSDTDTVGSPIEGRVVGSVLSRGKVAIPNGAIVHGRIRRLEHYQGNDNEFIVGLEFTELEGSGGRVRFYADFLSMERSRLIRIKLTETVMAGAENVTLRELPGVASFFVSGKTFRLPDGFQTVWRTRGPIRGIE